MITLININKIKCLLTFCFLVIISNCFAQNLYQTINSAIEDCRNGRKIEQLKELNEFINKNPYDVASTIRNHIIDSSANVRQFVANILGRTGVLCESIYLRQNICEILSELTLDKSKGVRKEAFSKIKYFNRSDFNDKCKSNIFNSFRKRLSTDPEAIKVGGYIAPAGLDTILKNVINEYPTTKTNLLWSAKIAMARMGNKEAEYYCLTTSEKLGINDAVVYDVIPDLIYIRSRNSIDFVIKYLQQDEKNCSSSNPDYSEKIPCSYRIMELIAPAVKGFPVKVRASGDLLTNNYPETLKSVQNWFNLNLNNYVINDSIY